MFKKVKEKFLSKHRHDSRGSGRNGRNSPANGDIQEQWHSPSRSHRLELEAEAEEALLAGPRPRSQSADGDLYSLLVLEPETAQNLYSDEPVSPPRTLGLNKSRVDGAGSVYVNVNAVSSDRPRTVSSLSVSLPNLATNLTVVDRDLLQIEPRSSRARTTLTPTTPPKNTICRGVQPAAAPARNKQGDRSRDRSTSITLAYDQDGILPAPNDIELDERARAATTASERSTRDYDYLAAPADHGISKKNYIGKYQVDDESEIVADDDIEIFRLRERRKSSKKRKKKSSHAYKTPWTLKKGKSDDKSNVPVKSSCINVEFKQRESKRQRAKREGTPPIKIHIKEKADDILKKISYVYNDEDYQRIRDRKKFYKSMDLNRSACVAQLYMALADTHMFQVDIEKDQAFGLGIYMYALGPDRLVPYGSIFIKDVIQGGKVDRQGTIKQHDQIIKCEGTSFVGIKQEEALKKMKNKSYFRLIMGRRTHPNNQPVTKDYQKEILRKYEEKWFKFPSELENGDFKLYYGKNDEVNTFYTGDSRTPKSIKIDPKQFMIRQESVGLSSSVGSTVKTASVTKPPSAWEVQQEFLEQKMKEVEYEMKEQEKEKERMRKTLEEKDAKLEENENMIRRLMEELGKNKIQNEFGSKLLESTQNKMLELCSENVDLRLNEHKYRNIGEIHDDMIQDEIFELEGDFESLNRSEHTPSVSTFRTMSPLEAPPRRNGLSEMETMMGEIMETGYANLPAMLHSPCSTDNESSREFTYDSTYSSRRPSAAYLTSNSTTTSNRSSTILTHAFSGHSLISEDMDTEFTPVNTTYQSQQLELNEHFENEDDSADSKSEPDISFFI